MDFLKALQVAEAQGVTREQFQKAWDAEMKMKQTEEEQRLLQLRAEAGKAQSSLDPSSVSGVIEAHLQKFTVDQKRMMSNLREELQQQNQAHIADISRLLEGFASLVGRKVKAELDVAVKGLGASGAMSSGSSQGANGSRMPDGVSQSGPGSTKTWSQVHADSESSSEDGSSGPLVSVVEAIKKQAKKNKQKQNQHQTLSGSSQSKSGASGKGGHQQGGKGSSEGKPKTASQGKQQQQTSKEGSQAKGQATPGKAKAQATPGKTKAQASLGKAKQPDSVGNLTLEVSNMSLYAGIHGEDDVSSSVHFFPEDQPANMLTFDIADLAKSGKVSKSPIYYLQDCPCKVQLSLWFNTSKALELNVTVIRVGTEALKVARIFTVSGMIKNKNSQAYSTLFNVKSPRLRLLKSEGTSIKPTVSLKTGTGLYTNVTIEMLEMRNYILPDRNSVSINWSVTSEEVPVIEA